MLQPEQDIKAIEDMKAIEVPADTVLVHPPTSPQEASNLEIPFRAAGNIGFRLV